MVREQLKRRRDEAQAREASGAPGDDEELLPAPELDFNPEEGDAFTTMMEWLYSKIPEVKGHPPTR